MSSPPFKVAPRSLCGTTPTLMEDTGIASSCDNWEYMVMVGYQVFEKTLFSPAFCSLVKWILFLCCLLGFSRVSSCAGCAGCCLSSGLETMQTLYRKIRYILEPWDCIIG